MSLRNDFDSDCQKRAMSIWDGINRHEFEAKVNELQKIAPSQRPALAATRENNTPVEASSKIPYTLPIEVEKQVVDDIAFLAACESLEGGVTAATLLTHGNHDKATIHLAANEGVSDQIIDNITRMLELLEHCAQRGKYQCSRWRNVH